MPAKTQSFRQFLLNEATYTQKDFDEEEFRIYMKRVDRILENKFGFGHEHLEDYTWRDMFLDEMTPGGAVISFIEDTYGSEYDGF